MENIESFQIVMARKPLQGTVADNVTTWGVGGINVDGCRVGASDGENRARPPRTSNAIYGNGKGTNSTASEHNTSGRWPANVILDSIAGAALDEQSGWSSGVRKTSTITMQVSSKFANPTTTQRHSDSGGASRFFYNSDTVDPIIERTNMDFQLLHGDNREQLKHLADNSIDSIVCDPPYELGFMGKRWDSTGIAYDIAVWTECLRVLKPGGHLIAFGGTRTYHRMTVAIEDAGFEIRDCIMYLYGSGFPKGLDIAWQMHKKASVACGIMVVNDHAEESHAKQNPQHQMRFVRATYLSSPVYACAQCGQVLQPFMQEQSASQLRQAWQKSEVSWTEQSCMERWGDTEKTKGQLQRCEVCTLSHGVFADGSQGWVHHGTSFSDGAIPWQVANEDGSRPSYRPQSIEQLHNQLDAFLIECRAQKVRGYNVALKPAVEPAVLARKPLIGTVADNVTTWGVGGLNIDGCRVETTDNLNGGAYAQNGTTRNDGWGMQRGNAGEYRQPIGRWPANVILDESAGEALDAQSGQLSMRFSESSGSKGFFGGGKAFKSYDDGNNMGASRFFYTAKASKAEREAGLDAPDGQRANIHATVKPIALMRYLVRLVTPKGGTVLDPFMGSGSTGCAAMCEGVNFVGIELSEEYLEIARRRIEYWQSQNPMGL